MDTRRSRPSRSLPGCRPLRCRPAAVGAVLLSTFPCSRFLGSAAAALMGQLAGEEIAGGEVYDALVGATAAEYGLKLLTPTAELPRSTAALRSTSGSCAEHLLDSYREQASALRRRRLRNPAQSEEPRAGRFLTYLR